MRADSQNELTGLRERVVTLEAALAAAHQECHFAGCFHPPICGCESPTHFFVSVMTNEHVPFHHTLLQAIGEDDEKEHASYVDEGGWSAPANHWLV